MRSSPRSRVRPAPVRTIPPRHPADPYQTDTICAIATAPGQGSLAIVRLSGPGTREALCRLTGQTAYRRPRSHAARLAWLRDENGARLDQAMVTFYRGPGSYTGEDMAEVICHGGRIIPARVLGRLEHAGCRRAAPGEFTRRALLHGKLALSQAEAVNELIEAGSDAARQSALTRYQGAVTALVVRLRSRLLDELARHEFHIGIDDTDAAMPRDGQNAVRQVEQELSRHIRDGERDRRLLQGARVVIVGRANVGKSSLFNRLLDQDRSVVDRTPGTTRDRVASEFVVRGVPVQLTDTAGLDPGPGTRLGRKAARQTAAALAEADLVLAVFDGSARLTRADRTVLSAIAGRNVIPVINKADLARRLEPAALATDLTGGPALSVSCRTGEGVVRLRERLGRRLGPAPGHALVTGERHLALLRACRDALRRSLTAPDAETAALEIRAAVDMLTEVDAPVSPDDILDRVFAGFCVGK
jgi:tRNA modification GTPase